MATTHVFERSYYANNGSETPNRVVTFWANRTRENGATVWRGGVTFATHDGVCITTTAYDGVSWTAALNIAPRATKRRDNDACVSLYATALNNITTYDVLKDMGVYDAVLEDANNEVWNA